MALPYVSFRVRSAWGAKWGKPKPSVKMKDQHLMTDLLFITKRSQRLMARFSYLLLYLGTLRHVSAIRAGETVRTLTLPPESGWGSPLLCSNKRVIKYIYTHVKNTCMSLKHFLCVFSPLQYWSGRELFAFHLQPLLALIVQHTYTTHHLPKQTA